VDKHLYANVGELWAEVDAERVDVHRKVAAVLFEREPADVSYAERWWAKRLNMAACTGVAVEQLAGVGQVPRQVVQGMLDRYHRVVLAA
jgi:DNA polymerase I-like protein with 3'-5' exonuclease and polymerase domains